MKKKLVKIILYTVSVCLVTFVVGLGWLYSSLSTKSGLSSDFINKLIVEEFNNNSEIIKIKPDSINLRLLDSEEFLYVSSKNMQITRSNKPLATFKNIRMSLSLWNLFIGRMPVKKITVDGGILEYEDDHHRSKFKISDIPKIFIGGLTDIAKTMQTLELMELNSIDLRYSVKNSPIAIVSKSANMLIKKNDTTVSVEYIGAMLGRDKNEKRIKTGVFSAVLRLTNFMSPNVGIFVNAEGVDNIIQGSMSGHYNINNETLTTVANANIGDIEIITYLGMLPMDFPTVGGLTIEMSTIKYSLKSGGLVKFSGLVDQTPLSGIMRVNKDLSADINVSVKSVSSDILDKYWPEKYVPEIKKWMHKNIIGTYWATANIAVDFKNNFMTTMGTGTLRIENALLNYYDPLPTAKVKKSSATYDENGIYITIDDGMVNAIAEDINISGSKIDVLNTKEGTILVKVDSNLNVKIGTVNAFLNNPAIAVKLPHKDLSNIDGRMIGNLNLKANITKATLESVLFVGNVIDLKLNKFNGFKNINAKKLAVKISNTKAVVSGKIAFDSGSIGNILIDSSKDLRVKYTGIISQTTLKNYDIENVVKIDGNVKASVEYTLSSKRNSIKIKSDLSDNSVWIKILDWKNNRGGKTKINMDIFTKGDTYKIWADIVGSGDKKLIVKGRIAGDKYGLSFVDVKNMRLGRGIVSVNAYRKNKVLIANVDSQYMYMKTIRSILKHVPNNKVEKNPLDRQPIDITTNMNNTFSELGMIGDKVSLHIKKSNNKYQKIRLHLETSRPKTRSLISYDKKRMKLYSENIGVLYGFITGVEPVQGGTITMLGKVDNNGIIQGKTYVKNLKILDVPESTRLLKVFSIVGIFDAIKTKYLKFNTIRGGFSLKHGKFSTENISAIGESIAVSAKGYVDFYKEDVNLKGMILPSYKLGNLLGNIPIVGTIFSGTNKQGPITQTYTAIGSFSDYDVKINNSGILTIGLLRNLFSAITGTDEVPVIFTEKELNNKP